jgi:enoyl-CoA hydratase/carnithine racemase
MGALIARRNGAVLTLQLENPRKANALDLSMLAELDAQMDRVTEDSSVRVVVLRGSKGGPFSSGADIGQWAPMPPDVFAREWIDYGNVVFRRFEALRCPTVAAIEGICFGGGLELALCADLRVAAPGARFRFPEVGIGAIPGWEGGPRLARLVGRGRALEAVLTGREIDAVLAQAWGLANLQGTGPGFDDELAALVQRLASVSPHAAALAKAAVLDDGRTPNFHAHAGAAIKASPDSEIGIRAFAARAMAVF